MTYDWGAEDGIHWAAFYGDCEHEVYEVTAGHRITLTYNLYAHEQLGGIFESPSTIDMNCLTLYDPVKEALASPEFFPKGGTLGFHCVHAYAHTNDRVVETLPYALKGVDAVVFSIFKGLNLSVSMRAVIEKENMIDGDDYDWREESDDMKDAKLVATALHGIQISDEGGEDVGTVEAVEQSWRPSEWRNDIDWIGGPRNKEVAVVHLAYGNEATTVWHYSTAVIIVDIPNKDSARRRALRATGLDS
ncbi:MAG: hypothetical protein Q9226_009245 [Calogaya cf. arnoldii]